MVRSLNLEFPWKISVLVDCSQMDEIGLQITYLSCNSDARSIPFFPLCVSKMFSTSCWKWNLKLRIWHDDEVLNINLCSNLSCITKAKREGSINKDRSQLWTQSVKKGKRGGFYLFRPIAHQILGLFSFEIYMKSLNCCPFGSRCRSSNSQNPGIAKKGGTGFWPCQDFLVDFI